MPDESVHQFDCLAERGRFEVHLWSWRFRCYTGHITREPMASSEPPNSRSIRLGEHAIKLTTLPGNARKTTQWPGRDLIFKKWERTKWKSFLSITIVRLLLFNPVCFLSEKKEIGGGYCRRAPLVISPRYLICLLFFPQDSSPLLDVYLACGNTRADRSNGNCDMCRLDSFPVIQLAFSSTFTYECFFSCHFLSLLNLWKAQISSDDWRCPGHSYELHEAINRSRWEKTGLSCSFHKWEKTRHIARVCRRRRVKRDDRCPHWHSSRQSWVGTRPGITSKNSI